MESGEGGVYTALPLPCEGREVTSNTPSAQVTTNAYGKEISNPENLSSRNIRRNKLPYYEFISTEKHCLDLVMKQRLVFLVRDI